MAAKSAVASLLQIFGRKLAFIAVVTLVTTVLAGIYAFTAPRIYRAEVVLLPVDTEAGGGGALSRLVGQFGAMASLAGINAGGMGGSRDESLGVLRSRELLGTYIKENNLLPVLFPDKWDTAAGAWKVEPDEVPSEWDGVDYMDRFVRSIEEDKRSGRVMLAIEWRDPQLAARWANELVTRANDILRARSISSATKSLEYLRKEIESASATLEVRQAMYGAMEGQLNTMMLAQARPDFALRVIDPAVVPDRKAKVKPRRALILIAGFIFGLFLSVGVLIAQSALRALVPLYRQEPASQS